MANQLPTKTQFGAFDKGLAQSQTVDLFGNTWVTGTVTIQGSTGGEPVKVTLTGTPSVSITGVSAFNISQIGGQAFVLGQGLSAASLPVVIARDQSPIPIALPNINSGTASLNSTSVVYETSRVAKASPGVCFGMSGYSSRTSAQFISLFDATQLPGNGAIPVLFLFVASNSNFSFDFGDLGRRFNSGIVAANSSTSTTLTVGAADTWFDIQYQ